MIFGFFTILFSRMGLPKAHTLQWVVGFFEGLNFTNDQHPRNSRNLRTSKKLTSYTVSARNKYLYTEALTHSCQLFLHTYRHAEHSSCTYRYIYDRLFYLATMSTKICRKQHLRKSCNAKWRELTGSGTTQLVSRCQTLYAQALID